MARRTVEAVTNQTAEMIKNGEFGKSGDLFLSIRAFAQKQDISYVTAQRVAQALRTRGLLMLLGNHLYITSGVARKSSPLSKALRQRRRSIRRSDTRASNPLKASFSVHAPLQIFCMHLRPCSYIVFPFKIKFSRRKYFFRK